MIGRPHCDVDPPWTRGAVKYEARPGTCEVGRTSAARGTLRMLPVHYDGSAYHCWFRAHVLRLEAGLYEARRPGPGPGAGCLGGWRFEIRCLRLGPPFGDHRGPSRLADAVSGAKPLSSRSYRACEVAAAS